LLVVVLVPQVQRLEEELTAQRRKAQQESEAAAAAARAAAQRSAPAPASAPTPAPAPAPAKQQEVKKEKEEKKEDQGGLLGLTNALGVVVGGGLAGYVAVLSKNKESAEEALQSRLEGEKKAVAALTSEAEQVGEPGCSRWERSNVGVACMWLSLLARLSSLFSIPRPHH
jgi:hypothetical protein